MSAWSERCHLVDCDAAMVEEQTLAWQANILDGTYSCLQASEAVCHHESVLLPS